MINSSIGGKLSKILYCIATSKNVDQVWAVGSILMQFKYASWNLEKVEIKKGELIPGNKVQTANLPRRFK